jgi:hypothetical protein
MYVEGGGRERGESNKGGVSEREGWGGGDW